MQGELFNEDVSNNELEMNLVLNCGPWAFADRMLVIQRWHPGIDDMMMNFIPFWIQICGIPVQFLNREVIGHVARSLGQFLSIDYNAEVVTRVEFVRKRVHWDIDNPLYFRRNFQFTRGENTQLRFRFERFEGFVLYVACLHMILVIV